MDILELMYRRLIADLTAQIAAYSTATLMQARTGKGVRRGERRLCKGRIAGMRQSLRTVRRTYKQICKDLTADDR